jgi:sporulation protein YlmC with PRC-barrel domain
MSHQYKYAALAATVALLCGAANAQTSARTERADEFAHSLSYADYLKGKDLRASELVGARVRNADGDTLGEIEELVIPTRNGDDMLVILSVGGVLDVGDKLVALPYKDLRVSADGDTFYINRTEEQLKGAPAFTYEAQAEAQARTTPRPVERAAATAPAERDRTSTAAERNRTPTAPERAAPTSAAAPAERPRTATPSAAAAAKSSNLVLDVFDYRASDLVGAPVLDDRGENVGKVDDVIVSIDDHKLHAVLAIGGFAGFGAKLISMPLDDLQLTANDGHPQVRIAMTGEQLEGLLAARGEFHYDATRVAQGPATPRG